MFTGIIRHVAAVRALRTTPAGRRLTLDLGPLAAAAKLGDSIAVSGVCLTIASLSGEQADFDVVAETLSRTTLGRLSVSSRVNLEPALRLGDGLDGHLVQGHVDGLAALADIRRGAEQRLTFEAAPELLAQMVEKGSVAIDGVSLTLAAVDARSFAIALIPTTLEHTTLADLRPGAQVNIETDVLGKYVQKYLSSLAPSARQGLSIERLRDAGF